MTQFEPDRPVSLTKPMGPPSAVGSYGSPPASPPVFAPAPTLHPVPAVMTYPSTTTVVRQSNVEIIVAWVFTALTALYMLPWAVAATRRSTNSILIAVATFFLAWTGLGWLVLLVLSFLGPTVHSVRSTTYVALPAAPPAGMWAYCAGDAPNVRRWWDGYAWTAHTTVV